MSYDYDELSVRQWQEKFRAGAFNDVDSMEEAGWYHENCPYETLPTRLKKLAKVVMGVTYPFILDHYHILCRNVSSRFGKTYDEVGFSPLDEADSHRIFGVSVDNPYHRKKWTLFTARYRFDSPEYDCARVQKMIDYINMIGPELEQGIKPSFAAECQAVEIYAYRQCGRHHEIPVYRDGEHLYSYISEQDGVEHRVIAVTNLEDLPPGFAVDQVEQIKGLYIYRPEDAEISLPTPKKAVNKSHKRKGVER